MTYEELILDCCKETGIDPTIVDRDMIIAGEKLNTEIPDSMASVNRKNFMSYMLLSDKFFTGRERE